MKNQHSCSIDFRYYRARSEHDFFKSRNNIRILEIKTCLKKLKKRGNFTRWKKKKKKKNRRFETNNNKSERSKILIFDKGGSCVLEFFMAHDLTACVCSLSFFPFCAKTCLNILVILPFVSCHAPMAVAKKAVFEPRFHTSAVVTREAPLIFIFFFLFLLLLYWATHIYIYLFIFI